MRSGSVAEQRRSSSRIPGGPMITATGGITKRARIIFSLFALAISALLAREATSAQAQDQLGAGFIITKVCVGAETGTFSLNLHTEATFASAPDVVFDELLGTIVCGDTAEFPFPENGRVLIVICNFTPGALCEANSTLQELDLPPGVVPSFNGPDCDASGVIDYSDFFLFFVSEGQEGDPFIECTITNTFPTATLTVAKVC